MAAMHIPRWVYWAVAYLLVCQIQALSILDRVLYGEWVGKQGDALNQTVNILQIIIGLALFCRGFKHWSGVRKGSFLYISLAVFLLCSAAWSVNSGASLRAGLQYLFLIIGAIGAAENLEADDFMYLLAWVCFLAAVASLVLLVGFPANAYGGAGDFRGVFSQKNPLGEAMSMGALASLHGLWAGKRRRLFNLSTLVLTIFLTIKSQSATSLLTIFICGSLGIAIRLLQKGGAARAFAMTATMIMIPVILIAAFSWDSMLEMLGKDPTLTGRTDIWGYVITDIYQRPLLGWGYQAFWSTDNPAAIDIADALRWFVPQAHNGILEILLSVGLIGAVWFIYLWGRTVWLSLKCMRTSESALAITGFSICAGVVLQGISETVLLYTGSITFIFFITGLFCEGAISTARQRASKRFVNIRATIRGRAWPRQKFVEPTMRQRQASQVRR